VNWSGFRLVEIAAVAVVFFITSPAARKRPAGEGFTHGTSRWSPHLPIVLRTTGPSLSRVAGEGPDASTAFQAKS
jgi:hypothetical protein